MTYSDMTDEQLCKLPPNGNEDWAERFYELATRFKAKCEDVKRLTKERDEYAELQRGQFRAGEEIIHSLRQSLQEAREVIRGKWRIYSADHNKAECIYCGMRVPVIGDHPEPSDCIVTKIERSTEKGTET